jgi:hypothetical protein
VLPDLPDPDRVTHKLNNMIRQRVFGLCMGFEDLNDHGRLRVDRLPHPRAAQFRLPSPGDLPCRRMRAGLSITHPECCPGTLRNNGGKGALLSKLRKTLPRYHYRASQIAKIIRTVSIPPPPALLMKYAG